jgi:hypothetical protein
VTRSTDRLAAWLRKLIGATDFRGTCREEFRFLVAELGYTVTVGGTDLYASMLTFVGRGVLVQAIFWNDLGLVDIELMRADSFPDPMRVDPRKSLPLGALVKIRGGSPIHATGERVRREEALRETLAALAGELRAYASDILSGDTEALDAAMTIYKADPHHFRVT